MFKALSATLKFSLCTFACLFTSPTLAQVTTDGTVNTQVNQNGNVAEITGGERRGSNLFHSFQDFSVPTGNEAFFNNNADNISNIFSRVTGGNISNIDGAIRANGSANLFLINPAGIIFGNNARLDIGGSFYGSTASSVLFEDGEFSAVDNLQQPILTVNAPIGLGFRDEPGDIINRSTVESGDDEVAGLEVLSGKNLVLLGGNLNLEGGNLTAKGGNIELGSVSQSGAIDINENGSLSFSENITRGNIILSNGSEVDVRGSGGGNINVNANNLTLEGGERGVSRIRAGIALGATIAEAQAGDINIDATRNIVLNQGRITNNQDGIGNSGDVFITTNSLSILNGGEVGSNTFGRGNAGRVNAIATGDITADGENSGGVQSVITSLVKSGAEGDSGGVTIYTTNLNLTNGGQVDASTLGTGNAGTVSVTATGDITADGEDSQGSYSAILSEVGENAEGDSGGVTISTTNLNLTNGGQVDASTFGTGNAGTVDVTATGDITVDGEDSQGFDSSISSAVSSDAEGDSGGVTISTANLNLTNGGFVSTRTLGDGNSGAVNVNATGDITVDGEDSRGFSSRISSAVSSNATGNSGGVTISTANLNLTNGGYVDASNYGDANGGAINVTATGDIIVDGEDSEGFSSSILSGVGSSATGNSGGITISTTNLNLTNGGIIIADTLGIGNAGAVNVTATGNITADGENSQGFPSGIRSLVSLDAEGDSEGVTISTSNLNLTNGANIDASTFGLGNAGAVNVTARDITVDGEDSQGFPSGITSQVTLGAIGNSGGVKITTTNLNLTAGGRVDASTFGQGDANNVDIIATESISIDGSIERFRSGINADALNSNGNGGNIFINTGKLTINNGGTIEATNFDNIGEDDSPGTGQPGSITINANSIALDNALIEATTQFTGEASANINLNIAENITLDNNSFISAQAFSEANGGNVNIDTNFIIAFPNGNNDIIASAEQGQGGNININAEALFGIEERPLSPQTNDINASSEFSLDGTINVSTPDVNPVQGVTELPTNVIVPEETAQQACEANREIAAKNGLNITGKGGILPDPKLPLNSLNVTVDNETNSTSTTIAPIKTSQGKIQPARGIEVTKSGEIILTAHRTNNVQRMLESDRNCI